jgi:hypothetical protein
MLRRLFPHPYLTLLLIVIWMLLVNHLRLGSLGLLMADLRKQGILTKLRTLKSGARVGGIPFSRKGSDADLIPRRAANSTTTPARH